MQAPEVHLDYLRRHKVPALVDELIKRLVVDMPKDPRSYLAALLTDGEFLSSATSNPGSRPNSLSSGPAHSKVTGSHLTGGSSSSGVPIPTDKYLRLTILHSNDIHGDFEAEMAEGDAHSQIGGVALLAGYLRKARETEPNVLYVVAGDMLQGSVVDKEFKGISTMQIMNYLSPTVACLGNHEEDYGITHLLFLEKVARFPIVTSNLYMKGMVSRLFRPYLVHEVQGYKVLFIGLVTADILIGVKSRDTLVAENIEMTGYVEEVGKICDAFKTTDIDLTILVTHIGVEEDKLLASMLKPEWGVDLIIGGHSHTFLKEPLKVNGVVIAQAGCGSDQIGRFDLVVDTETNSIAELKWECVPVNASTAVPDPDLSLFLEKLSDPVKKKYNAMLCRFNRAMRHGDGEVETEAGNLFADVMAGATKVDVALLYSKSLRGESLGPVVTLGDLDTFFPYETAVHVVDVSGEVLKKIFGFWMRKENRVPGRAKCFQVNRGVKAVYDDGKAQLVELSVQGVAVTDGCTLRIFLQDYPLKNCAALLGVTAEVLSHTTVVATSMTVMLREHLQLSRNLSGSVEGRLVYLAAS